MNVSGGNDDVVESGLVACCLSGKQYFVVEETDQIEGDDADCSRLLVCLIHLLHLDDVALTRLVTTRTTPLSQAFHSFRLSRNSSGAPQLTP